MLSRIPILDVAPSDEYEADAQISWFVVEAGKMFPEPFLCQLWHNESLTDNNPKQVWIKVPTAVRKEFDE